MRSRKYRVVSDASVLGYFTNPNDAAAYLDCLTIDGVRGRDAGCRVESWGRSPYWDGPWVKVEPQPTYNPWRRKTNA